MRSTVRYPVLNFQKQRVLKGVRRVMSVRYPVSKVHLSEVSAVFRCGVSQVLDVCVRCFSAFSFFKLL